MAVRARSRGVRAGAGADRALMKRKWSMDAIREMKFTAKKQRPRRALGKELRTGWWVWSAALPHYLTPVMVGCRSQSVDRGCGSPRRPATKPDRLPGDSSTFPE